MTRFVTMRTERSLSVSLQESQHNSDYGNRHSQTGNSVPHNRTRVSPPSVPIIPSEPPLLYSLHSLWKQGRASKSPGCFDGGEEPNIIWPLSHTQLLPVLSQLKVKGCKSVSGFYDSTMISISRCGSLSSTRRSLRRLWPLCVFILI